MTSAPAPSAPQWPDAFISYSRRDEAFVDDRLAPALEARGKDLWIDVDDIRGGALDWRATVYAGIEASRVVVLSPDALTSPVCADELAQAVALNKRRQRVRLGARRLARRAARLLEPGRHDRERAVQRRRAPLRDGEHRRQRDRAPCERRPTAREAAHARAAERRRPQRRRRARATAGEDRVARIWTVADGAQTVLRGHTDAVLTATLGDDGRTVLTGSADGSARIWRPGAGVRALPGAPLPDADVAFGAGGDELVVASEDRSASLWDVAGGAARPLAVLREQRERLRAAELSTDGRFVLTAGLGPSARLWDPALETTVLALRKGRLGAARMRPDGRAIALGGARTVELWPCVLCARPTSSRASRTLLPGG